MVSDHSIGTKMLYSVVGEVEAVDGDMFGGYLQAEWVELPFGLVECGTRAVGFDVGDELAVIVE